MAPHIHNLSKRESVTWVGFADRGGVPVGFGGLVPRGGFWESVGTWEKFFGGRKFFSVDVEFLERV